MLSQTTVLSIRALMFLGFRGGDGPISPRPMAEELQCSPTYLVKTLRMLTKAGILRSVRGSRGGVMLAREPAQITLLQIVESCQGLISGSFCQPTEHSGPTCAFHQAMQEIHEATLGILGRWTLADLMAKPLPDTPEIDPTGCTMFIPFLLQGPQTTHDPHDAHDPQI
jgi:Rrf2 family transcriptional regulator, cysteine metabolism repressor